MNRHTAAASSTPSSFPTMPTVGGAVRAMAVLEFVAEVQRPVSPTEIARATRMNASTAFNLTRTLLNAGYLEMAHGTRLYTVGPLLHALCRKVAERTRPEELVRLPMQTLSNRFQVAVSLWRRVSKYSMMMVASTESEAATRIQVTVGVKMPLLHGSIGRLMAVKGNLGDEERRQLFAVVNFERAPSYRTFMNQAKQAAVRGWSLDDGNIRTAVASVSAPVPTAAQSLEYVCTATMFRGQLQGRELEMLASELLRTAQMVAPACGGGAWGGETTASDRGARPRRPTIMA